MRTPLDPRHKRRKEIVKSLFAWSFQAKKPVKNKDAQKILIVVDKIDKIISQSAPEWPLAQINHIDLAILRLAVYELIVVKKEPLKVVIDEAIELAKTYGGEKSPGFINGVLGTVVKNLK